MLNYEKLRLKSGYLLLGTKGRAGFVISFPRVLKLLHLLLWLSGILYYRVFESPEHGAVLSATFALTSVSLYFVTVVFELLRDRWLLGRILKNKKGMCTLLSEISLKDFLLAVKLAFYTRLRCILRSALFFVFPVAVTVYCFELSGFVMTKSKWLVCISGCALLLAVGLFFAAASLCPVLSARKLCCFEVDRPLKAMNLKTSLLDKYGFALLNFKLTFYPFWGVKKAVAGLLDVLVTAVREGNVQRKSSVNKL